MRELEIQTQTELEKIRLEQEKLRIEQERQMQKERIDMEEREKEQERQMQKERMDMVEREEEKERQLQKEIMEMEEREKEKERQMQTEREKIKFKAELRIKELEMQNKTVKSQPLDFGAHFDVTTHQISSSISRKRSWRIFSSFWKSSSKFKMAKGPLDFAFAKCYIWEGSKNLYPADCRAELQLWYCKGINS